MKKLQLVHKLKDNELKYMQETNKNNFFVKKTKDLGIYSNYF